MAILKIEVNTDDIYGGDPEDGYGAISFEALVKEAINDKVKQDIQKQFAGEAFKQVSKNISLECIYQIEKKLHNLINEDIVMQDRWGKPEFIGSVEDYIKQQIDKKLLKPVNSNGQELTGCSINANNETWIEYTVKKTINEKMKYTLSKVENEVEKYCKIKIDQVLNDFKNNTLNNVILERLNSLGVK